MVMTTAIANLVLQTSTSTGTGAFTLTAQNGKKTFATAFSTGSTPNVFWYFISSAAAAEWEVGSGHMSDAATLVRDTVLESSNANAAVNFSAGQKYVTCDLPATYQPANLTLPSITLSNLTAGAITAGAAAAANADATAWGNSQLRLAQDWTTTGSQANIYLAGLVTGNTGATGGYEKNGLFIEVYTNDPSGSSANRNLCAFDGRAYILNSNATGVAFGGYSAAEILTGGTGDGYLVAHEYATINNGADQANLNTVTSKLGVHIVADGSVNSTAALMFDNTGTVAWHHLIYSDTRSIATSGHLLWLRDEVGVADVYTVDKAGNTVSTGTFNGLTISTTTGSFTLTNGKTLKVDKTLEFDGTDSTKMTFPTTSATIARTDAGQTFTGDQAITGNASATLTMAARSATATPAAASMVAALTMGSANIGIYWGTGAPSAAAAQGSLYIRTDGGAATRLYINSNGSTSWAAVTSA
jgi:hypothetical protein